MGWFKNIGGFLGYIIGAVIILPLLLIGYNYFFINKNNGDKYLNKYLKNSIEIKLSIPSIDTGNIEDKIDQTIKSKSFTILMKSKDMGRDGSKRTNMDYRLIYDNNIKKYFKIIMFDLYNTFFWEVKKSKFIYAKVNKEELLSNRFGTKDNPINVFSARGFEKPFMQLFPSNQHPEGQQLIIDTSLKQYEYNVYMYLTYVMSRKEFKDRFEKGR